MRALSIPQPWAWAILYAGKQIKNCPEATDYRGPLLIHAAKRYDMDAKRWMEHDLRLEVPSNLQRGGIVGRVVLTDCFIPARVAAARETVRHPDHALVTELAKSPWWMGPVYWYLTKPQPLPFMRCRGYPGLFEAPEQGVLELVS